MRPRRFPWWTLMGVVLVVALVVGTGVLHSSPPTAAQRAAAIDADIRCPSCEDLSVAESSAPTAVTVRATVRQLVDAGQSDQQIQQYLVARYGSSIVLDPPAHGWSLLVWVLPLAGVAVAVAGLGTVLYRRRGVVDGGPGTGTDRTDGPAGVGEDPATKAARRRFLEQSLADADAEYLAGDLSDRDYLALRRRDMSRLAALGAAPVDEGPGEGAVVPATAGSGQAGPAAGGGVLVAEPALGVEAGTGQLADTPASTAPTATTRRKRRTWLFLVGAVASFAAALLLALTLFTSNRLPGQTETGGVTLSQAQQVQQDLGEAATYENEGDATQAVDLYQAVLTHHPDNEVALAQLGWLEFQTGRTAKSTVLIADGRAKLNRAVVLDPGDYAARLYLGTVLLLQGGDVTGAVGEYRHFLADAPPPSLLDQAAPELRQAFEEAGLPVPSQVPAT